MKYSETQGMLLTSGEEQPFFLYIFNLRQLLTTSMREGKIGYKSGNAKA